MNSRPALSDARLLIYAVIGLIVVAVVVAVVTPVPNAPNLSVRSTGPNGAMALRLWLEQSGYTVREMLSDPIKLETEDVLFILDPNTAYTSKEAETVRDWVSKGHTLIVAGDSSETDELLKVFNLSMSRFYGNEATAIVSGSPTLLSPSFDKAQAEPVNWVDTSQRDGNVTAHIFDNMRPVLVSLREGAGTVWVSGMLRPFTNRGLRDMNNARLVLNLLAGVKRNATITFDEARHGFGETRSISAWLFNTPPGWGLLCGLALTMTFLAMRGRRFGRALPLPDDRLRREPVEYIKAMANLFRRSGQRTAMLQHYRAQLRRRLCERYAIDPRLDDVELVKTIVYRDPTVNETALRSLLARLSRKSVGEADLVSAASEVAEWVKKLN